MTHQSQIQLFMSITLLKRLFGTSYTLKSRRIQRVFIWFGLWETSFWSSNWVYLNLDSIIWFCIFFAKSVVGTLGHLIMTLSILVSLCKNIPPHIRIIDEVKKQWVQNTSGVFFTFCKINVYGMECFRCVCHEILIIISLTFIPYGWYFTEIIIMVLHPCT